MRVGLTGICLRLARIVLFRATEVVRMDFVALGIGLGVFGICFALTRWCDRVLREGGWKPR